MSGYSDYQGAGAGFAILSSLVSIAFWAGLYVWVALALSAVFRKAGIPAWRAWVPVVNTWTLFTLGGMRGWWAIVIVGGAIVLPVIQFVVTAATVGGALSASSSSGAAGIVVTGALVVLALYLAFLVIAIILQVRMLNGIGRGFALGVGYTILGLFLFPIWASVVGWGSARWVGRRTDAQPAFLPPMPPPPSPFALGTPPAPPRPPAPPVAPGAPAADRGPAGTPPAAPTAASFAPPPPPPAGPAYPPAAPAFAAAPAAPPAPPASFAPPAPAPAPATTPAPVVPPASFAPPAPAPAPAAPPAYEEPADDSAPWAPHPGAGPEPVRAAGRAAPVLPWGEDAAEPVDDRTVVADRRAVTPSAHLTLPDGSTVGLTGEFALLGRSPAPRSDAPDAQLVAIVDETRTVSKTHALLTRTATGWAITDLDSMNGVALIDPDGTERDVTGTTPLTARFLLGDAELGFRAGH